MKTKTLEPGDVDNLPRSYSAPGLSPERDAWLDAIEADHNKLKAALAAVDLKWEHTSSVADGGRAVYVEGADGRKGLLILEAGDEDHPHWPSRVVWRGVVKDELGLSLELGLVERGCAGLRDFGGLWLKGQGASIHGPVKDDGDGN